MATTQSIPCIEPTAAVRESVQAALADQPWYVEKKDSISTIAGFILQAATGCYAVYGHDPKAAIALSITIFIAQIFIIGFTPGSITKSMEQRLTEKSENVTAAVEAVEQDEEYKRYLDERYSPGVSDMDS